jgi:hypothetical protein
MLSYPQTLDIYFEALSTIDEWTSFENTFGWNHREDAALLTAYLPPVYIEALCIVYDIQHAYERYNSESKWESTKAKGKCLTPRS